MNRRAVTLDKIAFEDWPAVHPWACLAEACRWPNTEDQTRDFVKKVAKAWSDSPQRRFSYAARLGRNVVGMGELHVRSQAQRQGEITYIGGKASGQKSGGNSSLVASASWGLIGSMPPVIRGIPALPGSWRSSVWRKRDACVTPG
jgi:hypothetical protein